MATYKQIQDQVQTDFGFAAQTCWIAHVLSDYGRTRGVAPNRKTQAARIKPCPPGKRAMIEATLRSLRMLPDAERPPA